MKFKPMILSAKTYMELKGCFTRSFAGMFIRERPDPTRESFEFGGIEFVRGKVQSPKIHYAIKPLEEYLEEDKAIVSSFQVLEVPVEIINKAEEVSLWFAERGIEEWQIGNIQSRGY